MAEKTDKKQLKQPDAFQRAGLEASSWMEGKEKLLLGAAVAAVVIGFIIVLADYIGDRSEHKAQQALGAALTPVTRPVVEGADATPDPLTGEKPFTTQQQKDEAIVASLSKFRAEHPKGNASATAALTLAQAQYRLGKYDDALAAYGDFLKEADKNDPLRPVALEGRGYAHEAKGELDQALQSFEELSQVKTDAMLAGMGAYHKGRILILQGKTEEAGKVLAEIPGAHPDSAAARMALERLNLLASQGVKVPEPAKPAPAAAAATSEQAG